MITVDTNNGREDWEIQDDFRTLCKAREIIQDSKRLESVKKVIEEQKKALEDLSNDEFLKKLLGESTDGNK